MEDEEDNLSTVNNSALHQVEDSITEGKLLGIEENPNMAANLVDSKLDGVGTPVGLKEEEPSAEEEITTEVKEEPKLDDFGAEPSRAAEGDEDDEAAAAEEIPTVDTKIETEAEAAIPREEHAAELSDTHRVEVYSPIAAEIEPGDSTPEMKPSPAVEAETLKGDGGELDELQESQLVGAEPSIVVNHDGVDDTAVEETPADPEMEEEETTADHQMYEMEETTADPKMEEEETQADPQVDEEEETPAKMEEEEAESDEEEEAESDEEEVDKGSGDEIDDSQLVGAEDDEDEAMAAEEETPSLDTEMETETDAAESAKVGGGKRKRGRNSKGPAKAPVTRKKTMEEDVCFICFDGGELVLCDRRGCPKAYHPSCVNRDEAFFRAKGRWNCGWHQCSICEKNAHYMCYTCTYSLCKGCIKNAVILCVRGNKGFCESCMKTVMLIENDEQGNKEVQVDFNDRSSWEYLFKDYWLELKEKLSLSSVEIAQAKSPCKRSDPVAGKQGSPDERYDVNEDGGSASENSSESLEERKPKKRRGKKLSKSLPKEQSITRETLSKGTSSSVNTEWASNELLEFVMHMRNGDKTILSQFDVQAMLLEYIKRNKLRDPRRKSQIICDVRLQNLFGKARVGHFEMLKLLESHFLIKEDSQIDDIQGSVVDTDTNLLDGDANADLTKGGKDKKRKMRKKGGGPQSNVEDYAAIDTHNINLIYLRRKLMEDLLEDTEKFNEKVVGTFVRIRIPGNNQKQDIYRLVQVVGTSKAATPYKVSKRTTDIMLEILNLDKNEVVSIDSISNQEFTEDECKRLRQSIKCGLINRLTVGDILDKAMEIQAARVNDWMETEIVRLSHLRDRASEKGRRKELRECVEKLQLLKTPEERRRRLEEITEIHADPKMDPSYESEDNGSEMEEDTKREVYTRPRGSAFSRRPREPISPGRGSDLSPKDSWSGNRKNPGKNWELNRSLSNKSLPTKIDDATPNFERLNENSWNQRRDKEAQRESNIETIGFNTHSAVSAEPSPVNFPAPVVPTAPKISETDKMWHYKDPSGKAQGPFSMVQLRKWSKNGYFPADLKIWRAGKESDLILLSDVLAGRFPADTTPAAGGERNLKSNGTLSDVKDVGERILKSQLDRRPTPSVEVPKVSVDVLGPEYSSMDNSANLPSPTPKQSSASWTGGALQSPTPDSSQLLRSSSSVNPGAASKEYNATPSLGILAPTSLLNSGGQSIGVSENTPASSHYGFSAAPSSQLTVGGESHGAQTYSNPVPTLEPAANMVQSVNSQNPAFGTQGWVSAPAQNFVPNSSVHVPGQPPAYAHWGGVPSEPWRPPIQGNQMNMQPQLPPNVPWGMGVAENNLRPDNPNAGWVAMPGNPNMGWVGPVPGNTNMNWGPAVPSGNVNPGWVVPQPGNQGFVPGNLNPGWVAPPANQAWVAPSGPAPGNANPGWVPPNPVPNVQAGNANQGWVAGTGNAGGGNNNIQGPAPGNPNQGWGSPATNRGSRGSEPHHHGDRFSGRRDNRPWNRQSSFGSGGSGGSSRSSPRGPPKVCSYYENGNCKKGSSCDFMHN